MYSSIYPSYVPLAGYGGIGGYSYGASVYGGYPNGGGYSGLSYGSFAPRSPWSGPTMIGISPLPYGSPSAMYPAFMSGGVGLVGVTANGFNGIVGPAPTGKSSQASSGNEQVVAHVTHSQKDRRGNVISLGMVGNYGGESSKQNHRGTSAVSLSSATNLS